MEPYLLQILVAFLAGLVVGVIIMLLVNKVRSGTMSPSTIKKEYQDYQSQVEEHFEETSKKFKDMTEQYQDLYKHLSVGATSLCRPDSVAASLADASEETVKLEKPKEVKTPEAANKTEPKAKEQLDAKAKQQPELKAKQQPETKTEEKTEPKAVKQETPKPAPEEKPASAQKPSAQVKAETKPETSVKK